MSDSTPTIGDPQDEFALPSRTDKSLRELVDTGEFDDVHFFFDEAIEQDVLEINSTDEGATFVLIPYEHPENAVSDEAFALIDEAGFEQATFRDLLNFSIDHPGLQHEYDILALDTLRTRRIFTDREGETVWNQSERDRSICQWVTGLSNLKNKRTLVPVELYLDKVLRKDTVLLVRKS